MNETVRFGRFEFSLESGQLQREGIPVRLQAQPAKVLALLISRSPKVVTREELQREVWGSSSHVDFERGLNFCIAQIRSALGDSAEGARYLETVPKRGYRFIAPVSLDSSAVAPSPPRSFGVRRVFEPVAGLAVLSLIIAAAITLVKGRAVVPTVVVIPFYNETADPRLDTLASALGDALVARLAAPERARAVHVIGNAPALRNPFARADVQEISRKLGAEYLIVGQLKSDSRLRVIAHFIRVSDMKHLWANTFDDDRFALDAQRQTAEAVASAVSGSLSNAR